MAALIKAEYRAGKRSTEASGDTLGAVIDEYIAARSAVLSPSTIRGYKEYRKSRFSAYMDKPVGEIDWQRAVNDEASYCAPKTLRNAWGLVKASLKARGIHVDARLPASARPQPRWLAPDQIPVFLDAIYGKPVELGALLALHSLRRSEIYGLDWSDVDLDNSMIHVRQSCVVDESAKQVIRQQTKTLSSTRDVPIFIDRLYELLKASAALSGSVMSGNINTLRKQLKAVCEAHGLPDIGVHGLRHSFASLCYHIGVPEITAMQLGGWSDYQTMRKIYTHVSSADKEKCANDLKSFFTNIAN